MITLSLKYHINNKFNDRNELYDTEQNYMIQYDSINNGWNTIINKISIDI